MERRTEGFSLGGHYELAGMHGFKETNGSGWYESKMKRAAILSDYDDLWTSLSDINRLGGEDDY